MHTELLKQCPHLLVDLVTLELVLAQCDHLVLALALSQELKVGLQGAQAQGVTV